MKQKNVQSTHLLDASVIDCIKQESIRGWVSNYQFVSSDQLLRLKDVLAADSETYCKDYAMLIKVKVGKVKINILYLYR